MPYKLRNNRRHKFKKVHYKITNWPEYNEALTKRGDITVWLSPGIIKAWHTDKNKPKQQGRQFKYSDIAIEASLIIKTVYSLPYRATEGLLCSIITLMDLDLDIPDYTSMCRRTQILETSKLKNINNDEHIHILIDSTGLKIFGQGQWQEEKHGLKKRREWRKLHLVIDRNSQAIVAQELSTYHGSDDSQVGVLLKKIEQNILSASADTAYDTDPVYEVIAKNTANSNSLIVAIPPRKDAALSAHYQTSPTARDHNILFAEKYGKYRWQDYSGYHYRALVETAMFRYKTIIGEKMFSRNLPAQKVESKVACLVLNKMTSLGMPISSKIKNAA